MLFELHSPHLFAEVFSLIALVKAATLGINWLATHTAAAKAVVAAAKVVSFSVSPQAAVALSGFAVVTIGGIVWTHSRVEKLGNTVLAIAKGDEELTVKTTAKLALSIKSDIDDFGEYMDVISCKELQT